MPKSELVLRLLHHQGGRDQLLDEWEEVLFIMLGECLQERKVAAASSYCCQSQDLSGRHAESITAQRDGILYAARDVPLAGRLAVPTAMSVDKISYQQERGEQFFDKKGIAFCECIQSIGHLQRDGARKSEDRMQHGLDLLSC